MTEERTPIRVMYPFAFSVDPTCKHGKYIACVSYVVKRDDDSSDMETVRLVEKQGGDIHCCRTCGAIRIPSVSAEWSVGRGEEKS